MLEECLKSADEAAEVSYAKCKEAIEMLQKSEDEKLLLMQQIFIALKIQNDNNKTRLFIGLPSYASKGRSLGSG